MVRKSLDGLILWVSLLAVGCFHSSGESKKLEPVPTGDLMIPNWEVAHRGRPLKAMDFSDDGTEGWAVGEEGTVIHFYHGGWQLDTRASDLATDDLQSIWLSGDGKSGWIVGSEGTVLHRKGGEEWKRIAPTAQKLPVFVSVSSSEPSGENACMVGSGPSLDLWCFEDGEFSRTGRFDFTGDQDYLFAFLAPPLGRRFITTAWSPDGRPFWAFVNTLRDSFALRLEGATWLKERMLAGAQIADAWISPDGSKGWAVGNGVWRLGEDGQWASFKPGALTSGFLNDIAMNSDGSGGWAVGTSGVILGFNGKNWSVISPPHALTSEPLVSVWINADGSKGWVLSESGRVMLVLHNGTWSRRAGFGALTTNALDAVRCDDPSEAWLQGRAWNQKEIFLHGGSGWELAKSVARPENYYYLATNRDGTKAWALDREGKSSSFYDGLKWQPRQLPGFSSNENSRQLGLNLSPDGRFGLMRRGPELLKLRDGDWVLDMGLREVEQIWWKEGSASGWVKVKGDSNQLSLFREGERVDFGSPLTLGDDERISWLLPTERGEGSLAKSGSEGQIFRFSGKKWERVPDLFNPGEETPQDIWLSSDGRTGWIVGGEGGVWALAGGRWLKDAQASELVRGKGLYSVCVASDGQSGWAVGETGKILRYAPGRIGAAQLVPEKGASLEKLQGSHLLRLPWDVQKGESPEVRLIGVDGTESVPPHTIEPVDGSRKEFRLQFADAAESLARREEGRRYHLRIKARLSHSLPVVAIFESETILLHGLNAWQMGLLGGLGVTALNLLLFVSATRVRWIRTMVLHPVGSAAVGLLLGKYLLTDWLIRFVLPLKLAMFRDYRRRLGEESSLAEWKGRTYVPPQVSLTKEATERTRLPDEEDAWKAVFRELLRQPKRRLWLVVGPSGLGKTALLEQWTRMALELGKTPFLIRLRNLPSPESEAAALMAQYGDVQVTPEVARDLMTSGGFILFLDGYNEDRSPEVTREFVRQAAQRNLVVMTSQFEPDWSQMLEIRKVHLEPFGRPQLCQILKEEWVDKVLASPYLTEIARLPFTARLLAEFIDRNQGLPRSELEVYQDLRIGLDAGLLLNLEEAAWEAFKTNETELSAGPKLPGEFCDAAVKNGVLTRRVRDGKGSYRFRHERIHRLFVASYLERQDERPLEDWYKEVSPGLGRTYWTDVLDFGGQIKGRLAAQGGDLERKAYRSYLRKVAVFSRTIFKDRLYLQYDRLSTAFPELYDQSLVRWAALVLAGAEPGQESA